MLIEIIFTHYPTNLNEMAKTALNELKEKLQDVIDHFECSVEYKEALNNVIIDIDAQMLEKEKQQIIEAFNDGAEICAENEGQVYFTETYE